MNDIVVSVCCLTYNHEPYIRQCLEGFIIQKTDFEFEVLIHDDASTDNTAEIIREFEEKYPHIIKPIYQTENQYSKGIKATFAYNFPRAQGKYIAFCEGDDYWTDPLKLQKQINFLEANADYSICFHPVLINKNGQLVKDYITRQVPESSDIMELANGNYIHTPSVIFRKRIENLPNWLVDCSAGDYALHMLNAQYGKIKRLNDIMAVYRIHDSNMWVNQDEFKMGANVISYLSVMHGNFTSEINKKIEKRLKQSIYDLLKKFWEAKDYASAESYFQKLVTLNPKDIIAEYIIGKEQKPYHIKTLKQKFVNKLKNN